MMHPQPKPVERPAQAFAVHAQAPLAQPYPAISSQQPYYAQATTRTTLSPSSSQPVDQVNESSSRKRKPEEEPSYRDGKKQKLSDDTVESSGGAEKDALSEGEQQLSPLPTIPLKTKELDLKWIESDDLCSGSKFISSLEIVGDDYLTIYDDTDYYRFAIIRRALSILFPCDKPFKIRTSIFKMMKRFGVYLKKFAELGPNPLDHPIRLEYPVSSVKVGDLSGFLSAVNVNSVIRLTTWAKIFW
jgi:hypothetical protein